jgi:glycosyltransferase involved in cell wall biosynthesis
MSPANVNYLLKHNPEIPPETVEVNPNSIELTGNFVTEAEKLQIRKKFNIPGKAVVFVYGGNLGKPQGLDFLTKVVQASKDKNDTFFLVVGWGTEFDRLDRWFKRQNPPNALLLPGLPRNEYDRLVQACDVGLILLDKRFTIPNFPSRLLSYMECKMPVLIATDENSDMGKIAEENGFGLFSVHGDVVKFNNQLEKITGNQNMINEMGENGYQYLLNNYTVDHSYKIIMKHFNEKDTHSNTLKKND